MQTNTQDEVSSTLQKFQDGYTARDVTKLDEFMQLFVQDESIEMIGVGTSKRAANEWFEELARIRPAQVAGSYQSPGCLCLVLNVFWPL